MVTVVLLLYATVIGIPLGLTCIALGIRGLIHRFNPGTL